MDYSILINLLRTKQIVTPLEKDILDTWNELQKTPFDMDSSQRQILSNAISHPDIAVKVTLCRPRPVNRLARSQKWTIDIFFNVS